MKIALIGASGFVGSAILNEALVRGHDLTAILRDPGRIVVQSSQLNLFKGDVKHTEILATQLAGNDIVISAYNPGWGEADIYQQYIDGARSIERAVKISGVKRLLVIGGAGSLYVAPMVQWVDAPEFPAEWRPGPAAARDYLNILRKEKELNWTFLSPAIEMHPGTSGTRLGRYRKGLDSPVYDENGKSIISVEDVAVAVMDEVEYPVHSRQRFTVGY